MELADGTFFAKTSNFFERFNYKNQCDPYGESDKFQERSTKRFGIPTSSLF